MVVTSQLLSTMNPNELAAVIGHEISHIVHRDTTIATTAASLATAVTYIVDLAIFSLLFGSSRRSMGATGLAAVILAPLAAGMVQLAISRNREYYADDGSAELTGRPDWLAGALRKIELSIKRGPVPNVPQSSASLWISNPFSGGLSELFSTHPKTSKRIQRLVQKAKANGLSVDAY
ncbi:MAG: M48 family metalloprotease [Candidatus Bathyarchaeia archaeon]